MNSARTPWTQGSYRDLHGRGVRRPTFGSRLPRSRTNAGLFDTMVASQIKRLGMAWPQLVGPVQFAVEDVPPSDPLPWDNEPCALSRSFAPSHGVDARIVLYRLPMQTKAHSRYELELMIRDEMVLRLSELYGRHPEDIDPSWGA
ncbi:hypothetical protein BACT_0579 [Bifidobacterium actinocoloniiforme DSM 22766]|uniref:Peptidase n=1 Tax=Bifidobacterium actinocoloniiforme DSM 22766 TaxID=1437605 RepID=A0A086Z028_9BIFI|nr:metallopeptidase family protein [Bifidobacterium actinocoloniiforme]AKV55144.1 hypothetical protein AB656_01495 [Bifidobacterium actinocoloniiforme DSM 22766]KFI39878.1 hypothetical protein BACT_0579 [Bifidobacterium actinocoloniiforme DSM 22766]